MRSGCPAAIVVALVPLISTLLPAGTDRPAELTVKNLGFELDGEPFPYTGVSFFNAIYNPTFNRDSATRREWLHKFRDYGINVLRVWAQWDNRRPFVDLAPTNTLYHPDGSLRPGPMTTLKALLDDARAEGMVVVLALFSHESYREGIRLAPGPDERAVRAVATELKAWRNVVLQIWNEHHDDRVLGLVATIRETDPKRLVTSSPGFAGVLGPEDLNEALDYLTPHTSRQAGGPTWVNAPKEIAQLIARFGKPVVDDEPARNGTSDFGGPRAPTLPTDHILHIWEVWKVGGHAVYHHDMFQTGYGTAACPPNGIPDPEFSPYHRQVFGFLQQRERYQPR